MIRRKQSKGACAFCDREMTKSGMAKHLKACRERQEANEKAEREGNAGPAQRLYHLQADVGGSSLFWLQLEMRGSATLKDLDHYLREIWLECCGHMSRFSIGGWGGEEIGMGRKIKDEFRPGVVLTHIYDFGTESETRITCVDTREGRPLTKHPIFLMSRNKMPEETCEHCGEPAGWVCLDCTCMTCEWTTLCEKHAKGHEHDDFGGAVPLVNSPRMGMCGYEGPAVPPY